MVTRTHVRLKVDEQRYPIWVGRNLMPQAGDFIREVLPKAVKALIVADANVAPLYLEALTGSLQRAGFTTASAVIGSGEAFKTMATLETLYDAALAFSLKRRDVIVALGGGIVGDITGFLAATYMRGVPFIQVPTTLLAQVDASVGGKVAVNWRYFKNLVGMFYHPKGVLIDTATLHSLPQRDIACGMAEVVKYSLIECSVPGATGHQPLLATLQTSKSFQGLAVEEVITMCCQMKAAVVEADPSEQRGLRELLNLGHTFGHAYETLSQGEIPHGEAVAMGMVQAFSLSVALGQMPPESVPQVIHLLKMYGLPAYPPEVYSPEAVIATMLQDKKVFQADSLRLVLPFEALGKVRVEDAVSTDAVLSMLMAQRAQMTS